MTMALTVSRCYSSVCNCVYQTIQSKVQARYSNCSTNKAPVQHNNTQHLFWDLTDSSSWLSSLLPDLACVGGQPGNYLSPDGNNTRVAAQLQPALLGGARLDGQWRSSTLSNAESFTANQDNDPLSHCATQHYSSDRSLPHFLVVVLLRLALEYLQHRLISTSLLSDRLIEFVSCEGNFRVQERFRSPPALGFGLITAPAQSASQKGGNFLTSHFPNPSRKLEEC